MCVSLPWTKIPKTGFHMMRHYLNLHMSLVVRKPELCICKNEDADQLRGRGNHEADQRLCFCYSDSTIPLLPKFQALSHLLWLYSLVCVGPCRKPRRPVFSQRGSYVKNKGADQLCGNHTADQCFCLHR